MVEANMSRLFQYLLMLSNQRFYGDVNIPFKDGKLGQIKVTQGFLEDTLPQPHPELQPLYEAEVQKVVKEA